MSEESRHYNNTQGMEFLDISAYKRSTPVFQVIFDWWTTITLHTYTQRADKTADNKDLKNVMKALKDDQPLERHSLRSKQCHDA